MNQSLLVMRLHDGTVVYTCEHLIEEHRILIRGSKFQYPDDIPQYIEDEISISLDAVSVWFRIVEDEEDEEEYA